MALLAEAVVRGPAGPCHVSRRPGGARRRTRSEHRAAARRRATPRRGCSELVKGRRRAPRRPAPAHRHQAHPHQAARQARHCHHTSPAETSPATPGHRRRTRGAQLPYHAASPPTRTRPARTRPAPAAPARTATAATTTRTHPLTNRSRRHTAARSPKPGFKHQCAFALLTEHSHLMVAEPVNSGV